MFWNNKNKEPDTLLLQQYQAFFTTVDGVEHEGCVYKWIDVCSLSSVHDYLMIGIKSDGYMKDIKMLTIHPLNNVLSIRFELIGKKIVIDDFYHTYDIFFSNTEVSKMTEYYE